MTRKFAGVLLSLLIAACGSSSSSPEKAQPATVLPQDFLWGVASSAFQSEGGDVDANWNRYNAITTKDDRYGTSVDFRHRYKEDIALARDVGVKVYRMGIDWARLERVKGTYDAAELAYYDDVVASIRAAGMTPLITLDHWAYPGWVLENNGWVNAATVTDFMRFVQLVVDRYHDDTHLWLTFNEAVFYLVSEARGRILAPVSGYQFLALEPQAVLMMDNIVEAHRQAYGAIHAADPQAMVSSNIVWMGSAPGANLLQAATDALFLDRTSDKMDYIAFDYYYADVAMAVAQQDTWAADPAPEGIYDALIALSGKFPQLPILVAENGISTENGLPRADGRTREGVLADTIYWVQKARADGVDVFGYLYWSLTDNFEWGSYTPRFGLYTVNVLTDPSLTRIPTPAVEAYQRIIRDNGVPASYLPTGS